MPHFTSSGYSGKVVEVDLHTDALGSVRLHGVVTDFADFYATGGVGPYDGQVNISPRWPARNVPVLGLNAPFAVG